MRTRRSRQPEPVVIAQALDYVNRLARRDLNPLVAVLGSRDAPSAFHQYPGSGINWIDDALGYFYHSHGRESARRAEHGHFHLFARAGRCGHDSYSHLLGIAVDATGAPQHLFMPNLWVTAGHWRSAVWIRCELSRFADVAMRTDSGPECWIGMILKLYPAEVCEVLRQRQRRAGYWQGQGELQRRLADRRIRVLSSVRLSMAPGAAS